MDMIKIPMTALGVSLLREELQRLKSVERPRIIAAIAEARAHGDLKENAEYHAAREQQSFVEGRILEIESKLSSAQVIDVTQIENTGKVIFGTTVTLFNTATEESVTYKIVGDDEADIQLAKISVSSPIARAMIGKFVEDVIEVRTPEGVTEYEIVEVVHE
jgi:transcription elongation factor GreA